MDSSRFFGGYISLETARLLENEVWGQGFPAPLFLDDFEVEQQRIHKEKHLKLKLRKGNTRIEAIQFNFSTHPATKPALRFGWRLMNIWGLRVRS